MARLPRRSILAAVSGSAGLFSGCFGLTSCGAAGPYIYDDVLRVGIDGFHRTESGAFVGQARVIQPGPKNLQRTRYDGKYNTEYDGVEFSAHSLDGTEVVRESLGAFSPGTVRRTRFETDRFPDVITAVPDTTTGTYEGRCSEGLSGSDVRGYLGYHTEGFPLDWQRYVRREQRIENSGRTTGHVWYPFRIRATRRDRHRRLRGSVFQATVAQQRYLARQGDGSGRFALLSDVDERFRRRETYLVRIHRSVRVAPRSKSRKTAATIPGIARSWVDKQDQWATHTDKEIDRETFARLYAELQGSETPTMPSFSCSYNSPDNVSCKHHRRGHRRPGKVVADYTFELAGETWALTLKYTWEGLPDSITVGQRLES